MSWDRTVTGIQLHHVTNLQDAARHLGNARQALRSAYTRTGDPRYLAMQADLDHDAARTRELEAEARDRLQAMDPDQFERCRDGEEPWPDEIAEGFVPRHTCNDRCLYHDYDVLDAILQCICARPPCRACEQQRGAA